MNHITYHFKKKELDEKKWPKEFAQDVRYGDLIRAEDGTVLKVIKIVHYFNPRFGSPFIELTLE